MARQIRRKVLNIIGAFLIYMSNEPYYYWGNLSVYVASYVLRRTARDSQFGDELDSSEIVEPALALTVYAPFWLASMLLSGILSRYIHPRLILGFAIIVQNCSFLSIYFLSDVSTTAVFTSFGSLVGLGNGFYEGILLQHYVMNQSKKNVALLMYIVIAGGAIGGMVFVQFITCYTNPENLILDSEVRGMNIFSQEEIINKIPSMLLITAATLTGIQSFGLFLLSDIDDINEDSSNGDLSTFNGVYYDSTRVISENAGTTTLQEKDVISNIEMDTEAGKEDVSPVGNSSALCLDGDHANNGLNFTPGELLRCTTFYNLSLVYALAMTARVVVSTYYKIYGQEWIHDDYFLTNVGTIQAISTIPASLVCGVIMDRATIKLSLIILNISLVVSLFSMYFTARWNRWAYLAANIFATAPSSIYPCFSIIAVKWFGMEHFTMNLAIMDTSATISVIIFGLIFDHYITIYGHVFEFMLSSCACVLALVLVVVTLPEKLKTK